MPFQLHKVLLDGSVTHEEFTKARWEAAMSDPHVAWRCGHAGDDCFDPRDLARASVELLPERIIPPSAREISDRRRQPKKPTQGSLFDDVV